MDYCRRMVAEVVGSGVLFRLATDYEVRELTRAWNGAEFHLDDPPRAYVYIRGHHRAQEDEVYVVSQAFVDLELDGRSGRWVSAEHHGHAVSTTSDVTLELLALRAATEDDMTDLLADMRIAQLNVTRWQIMSAPRRTELASDLRARLAPLRRG